MNSFVEKQTSDAENEQNIAASNLLAEIAIILPDYFIGDFDEVDGGVSMKFLNGQVFTLKIA